MTKKEKYNPYLTGRLLNPPKVCDANFLEINVSKTKEMVIDFRISCSPPSSIVLKGSTIDRVSSYRYLGIMIDDKLAWHDHIDYLIKRLNVRMYCFRKLNYFHVDKRILALFYESVVASVWRYCLLSWLCWDGNVSQLKRGQKQNYQDCEPSRKDDW